MTRETAGQPTVLSEDEELLIVERLVMQGEWGFPLTTTDLQNIIKDYLDSQGRTTRFVENRPGPVFVYGFLERHPTISVRKANLVKRSRAGVTQETVQEFFAKYAVSAEGIRASNIFNYDETYLQENPGIVKAICRYGTYQYDTPPHDSTPHEVPPHNNTPKGYGIIVWGASLRIVLCGGMSYWYLSTERGPSTQST